ncbi:hypothetical protein ACIQVU_19290 [Lysinibacillus sp. NPDC098008]|uniref:hypothetical protein n=1 Tax=Lysinibacillus sp. NPDC098008 TaxID=3364146 RepID=UPI0037F28E3C
MNLKHKKLRASSSPDEWERFTLEEFAAIINFCKIDANGEPIEINYTGDRLFIYYCGTTFMLRTQIDIKTLVIAGFAPLNQNALFIEEFLSAIYFYGKKNNYTNLLIENCFDDFKFLMVNLGFQPLNKEFSHFQKRMISY